MPFSIFVFSAFSLCAVALILGFIRYSYTARAKYIKKDVRHKLFGWYRRERIMMSSSEHFKGYMNRFNKATIAMWLSFLLAIAILILGELFGR